MTTKEKQAIGGAVLLFWAGLAAAKPIPTLRIDRRVWALEEDVFFWSGVRSEADLAPEDVEGCGVEITAPDGTKTQHPFYWPADGDPRHGWSGGTGVAASETVEGEYRVLIENLAWEDVGQLELDRVAPGEAHERSFCLSALADLCSIAWPPDYFAVSTTTQLLVGPPGGRWAGAGPFRLSASAERVLP